MRRTVTRPKVDEAMIESTGHSTCAHPRGPIREWVEGRNLGRRSELRSEVGCSSPMARLDNGLIIVIERVQTSLQRLQTPEEGQRLDIFISLRTPLWLSVDETAPI